MVVVEQFARAIIIIAIFSICLNPIRRNNSCSCLLEKKITNRVKAIACIMVVIAHASYQLDGKGVFSISHNIGFIAVGLFFFISGYGLTYSLINKNNYLQGFLIKRLLSILVPFWISNIIVLFYHLISGASYSVSELCEGVIGLKLFVGHNWYVQVIIIYYILFFIVAKVLDDKKKVVIVLSIAISIIIIASQCLHLEYLPENCISSGTFILGIMIAYSKEILLFFVKINILIKIVLFMIMINSYFYLTILRYHWLDSKLLVEVFGFITPLLFAIFTVIFIQYHSFGNTVTDIIGKCSFEIYLLHQIPISLCKNIKASRGLEMFLIVALSLIMGYLLKRIDSLLVNKIRS